MKYVYLLIEDNCDHQDFPQVYATLKAAKNAGEKIIHEYESEKPDTFYTTVKFSNIERSLTWHADSDYSSVSIRIFKTKIQEGSK